MAASEREERTPPPRDGQRVALKEPVYVYVYPKSGPGRSHREDLLEARIGLLTGHVYRARTGDQAFVIDRYYVVELDDGTTLEEVELVEFCVFLNGGDQ